MPTVASSGQGSGATSARDNTPSAPLQAIGLWNGASLDRQRNNTSGGLDAGVYTATFNGNASPNYNFRGALIGINVTAVSGTGASLTVKVQGVEGYSGLYFDIPNAVTAAITAPGLTVIEVYPGISEVANRKISDVLPRFFRLVYTISGTTPSFTIAAGANFVV